MCGNNEVGIRRWEANDDEGEGGVVRAVRQVLEGSRGGGKKKEEEEALRPVVARRFRFILKDGKLLRVVIVCKGQEGRGGLSE